MNCIYCSWPHEHGHDKKCPVARIKKLEDELGRLGRALGDERATSEQLRNQLNDADEVRIDDEEEIERLCRRFTDRTKMATQALDDNTRLRRELEEAHSESMEQARLLGMSGEKELKLITELETANKMLDQKGQNRIKELDAQLAILKEQNAGADALAIENVELKASLADCQSRLAV
ncbi:MAG: hypothetical protein DRP42_06200, partial [Tenericutes bacterium]